MRCSSALVRRVAGWAVATAAAAAAALAFSFYVIVLINRDVVVFIFSPPVVHTVFEHSISR